MHHHYRLLNLLLLLFVVQPLVIVAQTLYVPNGTSGIGSSPSGNVGIGRSSPTTPLDVNGTIQLVRTANNTRTFQFSLENGTADIIWPSGAAFPLRLGTGSVNSFLELMRITDSGNVGIGATSPQAKLEVIGGANAFGLIVEGDGSSANARIALRRANAPAATGNIDWIGNDNAVGARISVNDDVAGSMAFKLGGSALSNTRILISSAGNVGIGVTTPYARLHVSQNIAEASAMSISSTALAKISNTNNTTGNLSLLKFSGPDNDTSVLLGSALNNASNGDSAFVLGVRDGSGTLTEKLRVTSGGNVGIGTTSPAQKLSVNGTIRAKEVIVDTGWSDYVFKPDYKLASLSEVEGTIKRDGHLPGIPSAQEVAEHGVSMGEMQSKLLAKVEELTLHVIAQEKHQIAQEKRIQKLETENAALRAGHRD